MKKSLQILSGLMIALLSIAHAQTTIEASDIANFYSIGKIQTIASDTIDGMYNIGFPGGGNTWDFGAVAANETFTLTMLDPSSTPFSTDFPDAEVATFSTTEGFGIVNEVYFYLSIDNTLRNFGIGAIISSPQLSGTSTIKFEPPELNFSFPVTFGASWAYQGTSTTTTIIDGVPPTTSEEPISSSDEIDAFGTLILPGGKTVEALRILEKDNTTFVGTVFTFIAKSGEYFSISANDDNPPTSGIIAGSASWYVDATTSIEPIGAIATEFSLKQNYPNPFNPSTTIEYSIPSSSLVEIQVFDVTGKGVTVLVNENQSIGSYRLTFDAGDLPSGIYFVSMKTEGFYQIRKMSLVK